MQQILVIEDESHLREELSELLKVEGFTVVEAGNGRTGIQLAQEHIPDLIVCDAIMPEVNGYEVLQALQRDPTTAWIPFIFLTGKGTIADFRHGLKLGADDYLTKPFDRSELLEAITTRLRKNTVIVELQEKVKTLQASELLKDGLLETVSHELRSPLANIMIAIQMLQMETSPEQQQHLIQILESECSRELDLVNDLLELQRFEGSAHSLALEFLSLQEWVPTLTAPFQDRFALRELSLQIQIPEQLPPVQTDRAELGRILAELLNNAYKYSSPGGTICLTVEPGDSLPAAFVIKICNPAEIPAEALPHLFDRFYRVPGGDRWEQGGTGLGLALVKKRVERLKGEIQVKSKAGYTQFLMRFV